MLINTQNHLEVYTELINKYKNKTTSELSQANYEQILSLLNFYAEYYYNRDYALIDDASYDELMLILKSIETRYPEYISSESPTQRIGFSFNETFSKVEHQVPMQSLQDVFNITEVEDFYNKMHSTFKKDFAINAEENLSFVVEEKIDGLSISVEYENGKFKRASTRGDGLIGEDISMNALTLRQIPRSIDTKLSYLEIRGEVYMDHQAFALLNEKSIANGDKIFANPRNAAAGSLRQLDCDITKSRNLSVMFFNIQRAENLNIDSHHEQLEYLKNLGLPVVKSYKSSDLTQIKEAIFAIADTRDALEYDIDGAVIKLDSCKLREKIGQTVKQPRWAVAYKYPALNKKTLLEKIIIQVGRSGRITPLAQLKPISLAGSVISRATLHNEAYIKERDIREGDFVWVQKAGDVIPAVVSVAMEDRKNDSSVFIFPETCPACNSKLQKKEEDAAHFCVNSYCPLKAQKYLEYVVSKSCLDIKGLGSGILQRLIDEKIINNLVDILKLSEQKERLLLLDGFQEKSLTNLFTAIEEAKSKDFYLWISALGINGIAKESSKILARNFADFEALSKANKDTLLNLHGIGECLAQDIVNYFANENKLEFIRQIQEAGVIINNTYFKADGINNFNNSDDKVVSDLQDKICVITGSFTKYTREELTILLEKYGAKISSQPSSKTSYLICGEKPGSKLQKAKKLAIKIIYEDELENFLSGL